MTRDKADISGGLYLIKMAIKEDQVQGIFPDHPKLILLMDITE